MNRTMLSLSVWLLIVSASLRAQTLSNHPVFRTSSEAFFDPAGGGGAGQSAPTAYRGGPFSHLTFATSVSMLGTGAQMGTKINPRFDARLFGNYLDFTHNFTDSGFNLKLNIAMANVGVKADFYPLHRIPLRITPGYLFVNQNRIRVDYVAQQNILFTVNHINWTSDNADPVHGTGRLSLGGTGPLITTGLGHIVSHSEKRFTFPFEAGVVFIHVPVVTFNMLGEICASGQTQCQPAATFPGFATNLAQQVASWNRTASAYHVYPILEAGVAYSFSWNRRVFE